MILHDLVGHMKAPGSLIGLLGALSLGACTTGDPTFEQYSYRSIDFPRSYINDLQTKPWIGPLYALRDNSEENNELSVRPYRVALSGFPHMSDSVKNQITGVKVYLASNENAIQLETSMGEVTNLGAGAMAGAAAGAIAGSQGAFDAQCMGDIIVCGLFYISVTTVFSVGGAVVGTISTAANKIEQARREKFVETIKDNFSDLKPAKEFLNMVKSRVAAEKAEIILSDNIGSEPQSKIPEQYINNDAVGKLVGKTGNVLELKTISLSQEVDYKKAALGISLDKIGLYPIDEGAGQKYSFAAIAEMAFAVPVDERIKAAPDVALTDDDYVIIKRRFPVMLAPYNLDEWMAGGGKLFETEMHRSFDIISERMIDYVFRIHRNDFEMASISGRQTAVAAPYRIKIISPGEDKYDYGDDLLWALNPLDFRTEPAGRNDQQNNCKPISVRTDRPTFTWMSVPATARGSDLNIDGEDLKYDLRIFDNGLREVYRINDIRGTNHKINKPLVRGKIHYWTVRANFIKDGKKRITDWTVCGDSPFDYPYVDDEPIHEYYPFIT